MNTLARARGPDQDDQRRVAAFMSRWIAAADRWLARSLEHHRRDDQERYLSRAKNLYELERLQREWDRGRMDTWTAL
jgi:hypothetical protein